MISEAVLKAIFDEIKQLASLHKVDGFTVEIEEQGDKFRIAVNPKGFSCDVIGCEGKES